MEVTTDTVIIGAGIAGASLAYQLADRRDVVVLEKEAHAGYHSTGRSAALFSQHYGNQTVRTLSTVSGGFYRSPPPGFADYPILAERGVLTIGGLTDQAAVTQAASQQGFELLDVQQCRALVPILNTEKICGGFLDPTAFDVDVDVLLQGYLSGARERGAQILMNHGVVDIRRINNGWVLRTNAATLTAKVIVNAAGAWADCIAGQAGVMPIGLRPLRRSAAIIDSPAGDSESWPVLLDVHERFYLKPDAGKLLISPADETEMTPSDVYAEDIDIAVAIDRVQQVAELPVHNVHHSWAGLRSFVSDRSLVIGWAEDTEGFFWLAGQGGYGVQTASAAAGAATSLLTDNCLPQELIAAGLSECELSPKRLNSNT